MRYLPNSKGNKKPNRVAMERLRDAMFLHARIQGSVGYDRRIWAAWLQAERNIAMIAARESGYAGNMARKLPY